MVTGTPWVASCAVTVGAGDVESCSGPEAGDALSYAAFGDNGTREFFTHVRYHKHDEDSITIHLLVELYARSMDEATDTLDSMIEKMELILTEMRELAKFHEVVEQLKANIKAQQDLLEETKRKRKENAIKALE